MESHVGVRSEIDGHVLLITIDRPKANAIDVATSRELTAAFDRLAGDPELRVAVLTGGGERFFSAGMDLRSAAQGENELADFGPGGFAGIWRMLELDKPVVAAVNGMAVGGGFELVLASDLIVATERAEFFFPEARVGNVADAGGVQRLPRRVPHHVAMDLLLTGRRMGAAEALHHGLVNRVVERDVVAAALEVARVVAAGAPLSVQATKQVVRGLSGLSDAEAMRALRQERRFPAYVAMLASEDFVEGPRAFSENRDPVWKGR